MPQRIAEELQRNNPETSTPSQKLDDDKLTELISQGIDVALQSRLYDDKKYVDKIVTAFTELANDNAQLRICCLPHICAKR